MRGKDKNNNLKGHRPSSPPAEPRRSTESASVKNAENDTVSPKKARYKPMLVPYVSVPRLSQDTKKKYIGGGDSDPEADVPQTGTLRSLPKRSGKAAHARPQRTRAATEASTAAVAYPNASVEEDSNKEAEMNDEAEDEAEDLNVQGDSIGERLRSRRAPGKVVLPVAAEPKKSRKKVDTKAAPKKTNANADSGKKAKGARSGNVRPRGVSGIIDVFSSLEVKDGDKEDYELDEPPYTGRKSHYSSPVSRKAALNLVKGVSKVAMNAREGLTPETAPMHHLYDYQYPDPEDVPREDVKVIWQAGRQCSYLGAPQTDRYTGYGYIRPRPDSFKDTGLQSYISYIQPKGDVLWMRLPEGHYIEEAYEQIPYDHLLDALEFAQRTLPPWFKAVMGQYNISDTPSTTVHTCELAFLPENIDHTMHCPGRARPHEIEEDNFDLPECLSSPPPATQRRPFTSTPPPAQRRPFTQQDRLSSVDPMSSAPRPTQGDTSNRKRKSEAAPHSASPQSDPISGGEQTPRPHKRVSKRVRINSPITEKDTADDEGSDGMNIDLNIPQDDVPMFDPYDEAEVYAWHRDAEERFLRGAGGLPGDDYLEEEDWEDEDWEDEDWVDDASQGRKIGEDSTTPDAQRVKNLGGERAMIPVDVSAHSHLGKRFDMRSKTRYGTPDSDDDNAHVHPGTTTSRAAEVQRRRDKLMEKLTVEEAEEERRQLAGKKENGQLRKSREEEERRTRDTQKRKENEAREGRARHERRRDEEEEGEEDLWHARQEQRLRDWDDKGRWARHDQRLKESEDEARRICHERKRDEKEEEDRRMCHEREGRDRDREMEERRVRQKLKEKEYEERRVRHEQEKREKEERRVRHELKLKAKENQDRRVRNEKKLKEKEKEADTHHVQNNQKLKGEESRRIRRQQQLKAKEDKQQGGQEEARKDKDNSHIRGNEKGRGCDFGEVIGMDAESDDRRGREKAKSTEDEGHRYDEGDEDSDQEDDRGIQLEKRNEGKGKQREFVNADPSTSTAEETWTAENIDLLQEVGTLLKKLLSVTRLPLHAILKKLNLSLIYSRENSWNIFKQYVKEGKGTSGPVTPFESYNVITSELYNKIKAECITKGDGAWELQKQQWRDTLLRAGDDDVLPPDALDAKMLVYFDKVLKHQQDLATSIRNNGPIDILTLVYSSETGLWGSSQFVAGDPALMDFLNATDGEARAFINNFVTVTEMFKLGAASPEDLSFAQFTGILTGTNGPGSPPKKTGKHQLPPQTKIKAEREPCGVECIADFRGLAEKYRANVSDIPQEVALIKDRQDRAVCRMVVRGWFADKINQAKPPPGIWRLNFCNLLVSHKLVFYCPSEMAMEVGTEVWNPNKWTVAKAESFLEQFRRNTNRIRMERWTEDNAKLLTSDRRYKSVPIVISSTKPMNTYITVNDTLDVVLNEASSAGEAVIGHSNKPLEIARKRSELKRDITALYRAPTIKNSATLNRFLGQRKVAAGQTPALAEDDDDDDEEEEEEEED
ncbi:hypothetical protein FA13DRAFT_1797503 [Coprinellus micaceus]|uniref:Uncharacterized protein n=1 Tax=Coprinellus micaceus TaxID=71717 RepID=A0A4Y7SQI6_COPMI|nr:hypothetical protein FA13DRAFT_1797503 [Coprinellus micaceus]